MELQYNNLVTMCIHSYNELHKRGKQQCHTLKKRTKLQQ